MALYHRLSRLVGLLLLIAATQALKCPTRAGAGGREIGCYTSSRDLEALDICGCTTLVHQGHDLRSLDTSDWKSLRDDAKEANPGIKVVLSISDKHGLLKSSASTRQEAANHLVQILTEVDGVELNATAGSKDRLVSFVKSLKDEMLNKSMDRMILMALPTKPEDLAKQYELKELSKYVDLFTVATHYLRDSDEAYLTFHPSRLMGLFDMSNTDSLVDLISGMGVPKQKILISAPASAYQFTLKKPDENTPRSATEEEQPVVLDRKQLCDMMSDGEWTVERDEDLTAPYAFKNTSWLAFEDETSLKIKGKYVILRELAGLALRNLEDDLKNDCGISAVQSVYRAFTDMKRKTRDVVLSSLEKDLKDTEIAYPNHVRSSDYRIVRVIDTEGKIRAVRENTQTSFGCSRQGYFTHPKSCNRFYRCVKFNQEVDDYSVFEFDCPAGLAFDERTEVCVWPGSVSKGSACPGSSEIEPVPRSRFRCPDHPGFYADPQNCRWFFACYDHGGHEMVPYEFRCPFGLVFDEHRLVCEWPWKVPNCNGPGHGGDHSVYHYGGSYGGQDHIPQGGIVGQGGFIGQGDFDGFNSGGINSGADFGGQVFQTAGAGAVDEGQVYNAGSAGTGFDGQITYNSAAADAAKSSYDGQTYNAADEIGAGVGLNGQTYNTGGSGLDGQNYNPGPIDTGAAYDGQVYVNNADTNGGGTNYDGQSFNIGLAGSGIDGNRPIYNTAGAAGADYDGQTFIGAGNAGTGPRYDGQTFEVQAGQVPSNAGDNKYDGQTFEVQAGQVPSNAGDNKYDGQNFNVNPAQEGPRPSYNGQNFGGNVPVAGYDGQVYNRPEINSKADCNDQKYNSNGFTPASGFDANNKFDGQNVKPVNPESDKGIVVESSDYDDQRGTTFGSYNGQTNLDAGGSRTTQFNQDNAGSTAAVNNLAGDTKIPSGFTISQSNFGKETTLNRESANEYAGAGGYATGVPTGFTQDLATKYAAGDVGVTNNYANNAAGQNDLSRGVTSQNTLITNDRFGTNYAGSTGDFNNAGFTRAPLSQNTNYNTFKANDQTNFFNENTAVTQINENKAEGKLYNDGLSTIAYDNTDRQNTVGFFETERPTVYNASYNPNAGYPSSTILPFAERQNTIDESGVKGTTPFNSVIYQSNLAMGLTSTEHFGTQYNNQAAKSFTTQGQSSEGYAYTGKAQNYNPATTFYDNTKINSAGSTPYIAPDQNNNFNTAGFIGGNTVAPATNFRDSTINNANFNTDAGVTNAYGNSNIIGSSIPSENSDITKFREPAGGLPSQFRPNGFTSNAFATDNNVYNQETVTNQNSLVTLSNDISRGSAPQNFNPQGTAVPGVVPLNNIRPAVELDNSGLFGTNFAGPTTPAVGVKSADVPSSTLSPNQNTGYRTNEYYDNGGRGTIKYNNGLIANKEAGNDIQDYRTSSYTSIPNSFIINSGNDDNSQSTIQKFDDNQQFTKEGFTKTGPTKTGITTAQVGGSGSYIIGSGNSRAKPNPQFIGANAFSSDFATTGDRTNFGSAGTTNFANAGSTNNFDATGQTNYDAAGNTNSFNARGQTNYDAAGNTNSFNARGQTNYDAGSTNNFNARGQTNYDTGSTNNFNARGQTNYDTGNTNIFNARGQTNFETATTAEIGSSQLSNNINKAAETEGYSYPKPVVQLEIKGGSTTSGLSQTNYLDDRTANFNTQSYTNQNALVSNPQNNRGFSTSTISPVGFTTNQLDSFRTTVYQAANLPQAVSTVRPVVDNGFKTVISSTPVPAIYSSTKQYEADDLSTKPKSYLDVGVSFNQGYDYSSINQQSGNTDYADYTSNFDQGNFGQRVAGQTTKNFIEENQNNELITSTQFYAQTGNGANDQTQYFNTNQAKNYGSTVTPQVYLPSSTLAPEVGVTFRRPIVAAELPQNQFGRTSSIGVLQNQNSANVVKQESAKRILSNQASSSFSSQKTANRILANQASADVNARGSSNGILRNQASASFTVQGSSNQASSNFASQSSDKFTSDQVSRGFSRGSINGVANNQASAGFISQNSNSGFSNGQFSSNAFSAQNQGISGQTRTLIGSSVVTSIGGADFNSDIIRQNGDFNSVDNANLAKIQQSTTAKPEVTTYSGTFSRTRSRVESNSQNKKVIVKLSDLHPLILGKLGAECTCKADPFAVFRGSNRQTLPINSQNRGPVDLANYDESDIYVDVDSNKEKEIDFVKSIPSSRLIKTSNPAVNNVVISSRGQSTSSTYLPPTTARISSTTYLPPTRASNEYLPPSDDEAVGPVLRANQAQLSARNQNRQPLLIRVEEDSVRPVTARSRSGKALLDAGTANELREQGASFDRYGPGGLRSNDEKLQGELDCARPGLFRHPRFCNKFYACHWDSWKKRYTLHVFNCPVHLAFDTSAGACNYPTKGPACQDNKLLV